MRALSGRAQHLRVGWGGAEATKRRSTIRTSLEVAARLMIQKSLTLEHVLRGRALAALPACLALAQATGRHNMKGFPHLGTVYVSCVLCGANFLKLGGQAARLRALPKQAMSCSLASSCS